MKRLIFILLAAFVLSAAAIASPPGEVKDSPLFKASLKTSIEKIEGKITEDEHGEIATSTGRMCPMMPLTQVSTCTPTVCGGNSTCNMGTCSGLTCDQATCNNFPTCYGTCIGGTCEQYDFWGYVWWVLGNYSGTNWNDIPYGIQRLPGSNVGMRFADEGSLTSIGSFGMNGSYGGIRITAPNSNNGYLGAGTIIEDLDENFWPVSGDGYCQGPISVDPAEHQVDIYINL